VSKVNVNGVSLEYFEIGKGTPLVLVHGSASDYRTWQDQHEVFGKSYRAIAYSRRYHWPNDKIPEGADYSMLQQVDDLEALLGSLNEPAHLVGHSYGGFVSLLLAIRRPSLVRTLALAEPPVVTLFVSNVPKPQELLKLLVTRPRTAAAIIKFGATGIAPTTKLAERGDMDAAMQVFGKAVLGATFYDRLSKARLEQVIVNAHRAEFLGSGFAPLAAKDVAEVAAPTLLITGQHTPAVFKRLTDRLEELLPNNERIAIPNASHIIHEDNPSAFNDAVLSFLSKHAVPARLKN